MCKSLLYFLLIGLSTETVPVSQPVLQLCKPGDAHAATFPDTSFKCKPGPARRPQCQFFFHNIAPPFLCPNNGYYSGWLDIPPLALEVCCTEPGLKRTDCITYETVQGQVNTIKPDRVIVGSYSLTGGRTWIRTECRYLGYPKRGINIYLQQKSRK